MVYVWLQTYDGDCDDTPAKGLCWGHYVAEGDTGGPRVSSYSPGTVDADYSLSALKTVCAWLRATYYEW